MSNAVGSYNPPDRLRAASCRPLQARRAIQSTRLACRLLGEAPALPRVEPAQWGDTAVVLPRDVGGPWVDGLCDGNEIDARNGAIGLDRCLTALPVAVLVAADTKRPAP
ncbi:TPA: hypothetical protein ACV4T7_002689 [Burkholderia ambifaria]